MTDDPDLSLLTAIRDLGYPCTNAADHFAKGTIGVYGAAGARHLAAAALRVAQDEGTLDEWLRAALMGPPSSEQLTSLRDGNVRALREALGGDPDVGLFTGHAPSLVGEKVCAPNGMRATVLETFTGDDGMPWAKLNVHALSTPKCYPIADLLNMDREPLDAAGYA